MIQYIKTLFGRLWHDDDVKQTVAAGGAGGGVAYYVELWAGILITAATLIFVIARAIREVRKLRKGE